MKKLLPFIALTVIATACNNSGTATKSADSNTTPNMTNVQNVNGNQPDTTTGIQLDTRQSGDTTHH